MSTQTVEETHVKLSKHEIIPHKTDVGALANRINMETRSLHNKIDKLVTLKFALALRDHKIYRQGLQSFYHVFAAVEKNLERELANPDLPWTPILKAVWKPEMARTARGQQDLLFFYDNNKEKFRTPMMAEQKAFAQHITEVTTAKPYLLLAYMHVMYLALFAGGRVMRLLVARATGLFPQKDGLSNAHVADAGTNFFRFDVPDEDTFRVLYKRDYELTTRNALSEAQKLEIIEESKYIFEQNARCITELERHNLARLRSKWLYFLVTRGFYVALAFLVLSFVYFVRRLVLHVL